MRLTQKRCPFLKLACFLVFTCIYLHQGLSLSVLNYQTLHGYSFDFQSIGTMKVKCEIQKCSEMDGCAALNALQLGNAVQCDFQTHATENVTMLTENPASNFICKFI